MFFASVLHTLLHDLSPLWFIRQNVGVAFQEELSDLLLLKMLQAATRASTDKDKVAAFTHNTSSGFVRSGRSCDCGTSVLVVNVLLSCGLFVRPPRSSPTRCACLEICFISCVTVR